MIDSTAQPEAHITDLEIATYLDRRLPPEQLDRVEAHLAACPDCREELLATRGMVRRVQRPRKLAAAAALAATTAIVLLLPVLVPRDVPAPQPQLRSRVQPSPLIAYGPLGETGTRLPTFVWAAVPGAASYRLTVTGEGGESVWSDNGADTLRTLPDSVVLHSGASYWWVADALIMNGTTRSTGLRGFRIRE